MKFFAKLGSILKRAWNAFIIVPQLLWDSVRYATAFLYVRFLVSRGH